MMSLFWKMPLKLKVSWSLREIWRFDWVQSSTGTWHELNQSYPVIDQFSPARRLKSSELSEQMKFLLHKVIVHLRRWWFQPSSPDWPGRYWCVWGRPGRVSHTHLCPCPLHLRPLRRKVWSTYQKTWKESKQKTQKTFSPFSHKEFLFSS